MSAYATIETWDTFEGMTEGYNGAGALVVEIGPAGKETATSVKWGERVQPGRPWAAYLESGKIVRGRAADLRTAKREALAAAAA